MVKKLLFLLLICTSLSFGQQVQLSGQANISVLTMGPGQSLFDSFGHSAIRLKDQPLGIDVIYNYGVYDFSDPNFYPKFAMGKLRYLLDRKPTEGFLKNYIEDNRWVKEQVLALSTAEVQELFIFLENNLKPENRAYDYDFFYDNCATKIPQIINTTIPGGIKIDSAFIANPKTFRSLVQENVHWNTWGSFGMDIGIGSVTDRTATAYEHMFLPANVYLALKTATKQANGASSALVKESKDLYINAPVALQSDGVLSPLAVFGILAAFILWITFIDSKKQKRSKWLDVSLAVITGIAGIILALLWFATEHTTTANNYNVLWAFPFSLFVALQLSKNAPKQWVQGFLKFLLICLALLSLHWFIGVQVFAYALIPLLVALAIRYIYVLRYLKKHTLLPPVEDNGA